MADQHISYSEVQDLQYTYICENNNNNQQNLSVCVEDVTWFPV